MYTFAEKVLRVLAKDFKVKKVALWSESVEDLNTFLNKTNFPKLQTIYWIREIGTALQDLPDSRVTMVVPTDRQEYVDPEAIATGVDLSYVSCKDREPSGIAGWQRRLTVAKDNQLTSKVVVAPEMNDGWYKDMFNDYKFKVTLIEGAVHITVASQKTKVDSLTVARVLKEAL